MSVSISLFLQILSLLSVNKVLLAVKITLYSNRISSANGLIAFSFFQLLADKNYTSVISLIEGLASGEVQYGILDQYMTLAYQAKIKNYNVSVKRILDFKGSIGFYAAGHAKKLAFCIETFMKENNALAVEMVSKHVKVNKVCFPNITKVSSDEEAKQCSRDITT